MKWCVEWQSTFNYLANMDQFNIEFKRKDRTLSEFLSQYATNGQRVNIYVNDLNDFIEHNDIELIHSILKQNSKISIALVFDREVLYQSLRNDNYLRNLNVFWYLRNVITDWDGIYAALHCGASEVIIGGQLGFELPRVRKLLHPKGITIRCQANIASSSYPLLLPGIKTFFIRPEDVEFYEKYIDVMELGGEKKDLNFYYKYYVEKEQWAGPLSQFIIGYKGDLNNHYVIPNDFANRRCDDGWRKR